MSKAFKTPGGIELPLMQLKGKDYLQVAHRLVWFREVHPEWTIETEFIINAEKMAQAKATVRDALGRVRGTGHKVETQSGFADFHEKAETGAIGRALAHCGFGTQFAPEMLEGDDEGPNQRIADSPTIRPTIKNHAITPRIASASDLAEDPGLYVPKIGKLQGKPLRDHGAPDVNDYISKLKYALKKDNKPAGPEMIEVIEWCEAYLKTQEFKRA